MKKHYSKIIAVVFALILCAVLFAACSNSGKAESSSSSGVEKATFANSKIDSISDSSSSSDNSKTAVQQTNKAAEKALQDSANMVPDAQTAKVGRTANIWLWVVLTIIVLSAVSLIFLSRTTGKPRKAKAKRDKAERNTLNERW